MKLEFWSKSANESFARVVAAAFASQLDATITEISELKTAVSEAVTNSIIHGYEGGAGVITMEMYIEGNAVVISVSDKGVGISDIEKARKPLYTSKPELERSGMGFVVMESFMDALFVSSAPGEGTKVTMTKKIGAV